MSRVGKDPITLPKGVEVSVADGVLTAKGAKGQLRFALRNEVSVTVADGVVQVSRKAEDKFSRALHGTVRAIVQNMVQGVNEGFQKKLEIIGVGYRAQVQGKKLVLNIGFCHPVEVQAPEGIDFVCPDQTHIEVKGIDKQLVGEVAAGIRAVRKPEPYKGKGIRYSGEFVRRKAGKSAK